jgi:hypothetical protein
MKEMMDELQENELVRKLWVFVYDKNVGMRLF